MQAIGEIFKKELKKIGSDDPATLLEDGCELDTHGIPRCKVCGEPRVLLLKDPIKRYIYRRCRCKREAFAESEAKERQRAQEELDRQMRIISIADRRHYEASFDCFQCRNEDDAKLLKALKRYVALWKTNETENNGILLYGPVGTGKTFAACCVANALREHGVKAAIIDTGRLIRLDAKEFESAMIVIRSAAFLLLDDFGTERETDYTMERIFRIVDARYNSMRPLWITTNFISAPDKNDLRKQRIWSRIFQIVQPIKVAGEDRRMQNFGK